MTEGVLKIRRKFHILEKISDNNINNNPNIFHPMSLCICVSFASPMTIANGHKLRTTDLTFTMIILSLDPVLNNISFSLMSSFEPVNLMLYLTNGNEE